MRIFSEKMTFNTWRQDPLEHAAEAWNENEDDANTVWPAADQRPTRRGPAPPASGPRDPHPNGRVERGSPGHTGYSPETRGGLSTLYYSDKTFLTIIEFVSQWYCICNACRISILMKYVCNDH